jgi:hypothetical protein
MEAIKSVVEVLAAVEGASGDEKGAGHGREPPGFCRTGIQIVALCNYIAKRWSS